MSKMLHLCIFVVFILNISALKICVLGGSGFVGTAMIKEALNRGNEVVALSRRGGQGRTQSERVKYISCDCTDKKALASVVSEHGPFDAYVHAIGLLLDGDSGLSQFNKLASGSASEPNSSSTYDLITRQTVYNLVDTICDGSDSDLASPPIPVCFVSAAEAGWTFPSPVGFLERYLVAKRAAEQRLVEEPRIREVLLRPSLIWTWKRPAALASVIPFIVANQMGLPFVDKPVMVETLCRAGLEALETPAVNGVLRYADMERLGR